MPKHWINNSENKILDTDSDEEIKKKRFNQRICAEKKPYFFIYNYNHLMKEYKQYIETSNKSCIRTFGVSIEELEKSENMTDEQKNFIDWYYKMMPLIMSKCTMNEICRYVEKQDFKLSSSFPDFNTEIIKSGNVYEENEYKTIKNKLKKVYSEYNKKIYLFNKEISKDKNSDKNVIESQRKNFKNEFRIDCINICEDYVMLCDALIDICYLNNNSKQFVWDICGKQIVQNLLEKNDYKITYPVSDKNGNITFCGNRYSLTTTIVEKDDDEEV